MNQSNPSTEQAAAERPSRKPFLAGWRRDALICLSLANCCFLRVWGETLSYRNTEETWIKTIPSPMDGAAVMTAVLLLAAVLYGGVRLARRHLSEWGFGGARLAAFGLAAIPLNSLRAGLPWVFGYVKSSAVRIAVSRTGLLPLALVCAALLWLVWRYQRRIAALVSPILVVLSPFCLLTFGETVWAMANYRGQPYRDGPLAPRLATAPPPVRVVWILFDEWDYRLTFVDRPALLAMPEIDRLRGESLFATEARSPAMNTNQSVPSLITGRRLEFTTEDSGVSVSVRPTGRPDAKPAPWNNASSIFSEVRRSGIDAALVGWYLPYCRFMNGSLSECMWCTLPVQSGSAGSSFLSGLLGTGLWGKAAGYSVSLLETDSLSLFGQSSSTRHKAAQYLELLAESRTDVADPGLGLVFLHLPIPHPPHPYNRFTGRLDAANRPISGYIDSLALVDRAMGELRCAMKSNGTWDRTVLLVSTDHPFRKSRELDGKSDPRVPFMLHFPGLPTAAVFTPEFNTIVSANLVYAILRGTVTTAPEASAWIERHRADRESPVGIED